MSFDKEKYWANKPYNIGSQRPKPLFAPHPWRTRRESRRKVVARLFRGLTDTIGIKHTAKGAIRAIKETDFHPSENPSITNHQRVSSRRSARRGK